MSNPININLILTLIIIFIISISCLKGKTKSSKTQTIEQDQDQEDLFSKFNIHDINFNDEKITRLYNQEEQKFQEYINQVSRLFNIESQRTSDKSVSYDQQESEVSHELASLDVRTINFNDEQLTKEFEYEDALAQLEIYIEYLNKPEATNTLPKIIKEYLFIFNKVKYPKFNIIKLISRRNRVLRHDSRRRLVNFTNNDLLARIDDIIMNKSIQIVILKRLLAFLIDIVFNFINYSLKDSSFTSNTNANKFIQRIIEIESAFPNPILNDEDLVLKVSMYLEANCDYTIDRINLLTLFINSDFHYPVNYLNYQIADYSMTDDLRNIKYEELMNELVLKRHRFLQKATPVESKLEMDDIYTKSQLIFDDVQLPLGRSTNPIQKSYKGDIKYKAAAKVNDVLDFMNHNPMRTNGDDITAKKSSVGSNPLRSNPTKLIPNMRSSNFKTKY